MEIVSYHQQYENEVVALWNKTLTADPMGKFRKQALFDDNFDNELCFVALEDGKAAGFVLATKRKFPYLGIQSKLFLPRHRRGKLRSSGNVL
ncbi:MAG: GCN5-related N-acetyltransferase [Bacillota bacterium]|nr:GCN5-related N-acetyltransferase [Bacillota bacterium]